MAGAADEFYVDRFFSRIWQSWKHLTVLEFGCQPGVYTARVAKRGSNLSVTGVDLYEPAVKDGYTFVHGDFMRMTLPVFDIVYALSSFEHCGLEQVDYAPGGKPRPNYHRAVAHKLIQHVAFPDGSLVVTVPFGPDDTRYSRNPDNSIAWGYRRFTAVGLIDVFRPLHLYDIELWEQVAEPHDQLSSWVQVDDPWVEDLGDHRGVLCATFGHDPDVRTLRDNVNTLEERA